MLYKNVQENLQLVGGYYEELFGQQLLMYISLQDCLLDYAIMAEFGQDQMLALA